MTAVEGLGSNPEIHNWLVKCTKNSYFPKTSTLYETFPVEQFGFSIQLNY